MTGHPYAVGGAGDSLKAVKTVRVPVSGGISEVLPVAG
jgi:hypothetical protein